ncbi:MAG: hydrogenase nickel incorporation protein HypB [Candidatus Lustribacter sp.]
MRIDDVRNVLSANDRIAVANRERFGRWGAYVVNLMSAPGAGKTTILERTLAGLDGRYRTAVIEGDVRGSYDRDRLRAVADVPVVQINTEEVYGGECHLDALMIGNALENVDLGGTELIVIENVGNLVCPAEFDVGENCKVMVSSVTEGEDKPLKYPLMYSVCDALLLNKIDLASAVDFDRETFLANVRAVNPALTIIELSARTGQGVATWLTWLEQKLTA